MLTKLKAGVLKWLEKTFFSGRAGIENADEALRYLPISDEILADASNMPRILEVGSGIKGITPYIPFRITGVDVAFNGQVAENLEPVCLSGTSLPFPDDSFDYVISVDMLEHVSAEERCGVVSELVRVAVRKVFLAVPCGSGAEAQDRVLDALYLSEKGERDRFLAEHVENGLPTEKELERCLRTASERTGRKTTIRVVPNVNLRVRGFFMRLWIKGRPAKLYLWLSPFFCLIRRFLNTGECYRQIFILDFGAGDK
ncbi:class I SAM-dependent methyltransferase [Geobacter sp.]|uniref:class I SAM-dependent methyltransferase n=1 Tax=Geobacter sp. TaxID=46610 RepID=UPI002616BE2A|nr:class I SAM-dependent methyltransferase [Geobacter sp.]